jgi:glycosyltransferase involved in cell wall biosynthesis
MAFQMASLGHNITLLVASSVSSVQLDSAMPWNELVQTFRRFNVSLKTSYSGHCPVVEHKIGYEAYLWLKAHELDFDIVHYPEYLGVGFFIASAKRAGIHFSKTVLVAQSHGPMLWATLGNMQWPTNAQMDYMERKSIEWSDYLISPSSYMIEWLDTYRWARPQTVVLQNLPPTPDLLAMFNHLPDSPVHQTRPLNYLATSHLSEVVFFGRLEYRKGVGIFCNSILSLIRSGNINGSSLKITFMGKKRVENVEDWAIRARRKAQQHDIKLHISFIDTFGSVQAVNYLAERPGRLAVIPSLVENSPYVVAECISNRIPFLVSDVGGVRELIHEDDTGVLFDPNADALVAALEDAIQNGVRAETRQRISNDDKVAAMDRWHREISPILSLFHYGVRAS